MRKINKKQLTIRALVGTVALLFAASAGAEALSVNSNHAIAWNLSINENGTYEVTSEMVRGQLEIQHESWLRDFRGPNGDNMKEKMWDISKAVSQMGVTAEVALNHFVEQGYRSELFKLEAGILSFNGNVHANEVPTEILEQKNMSAAENNLRAASEFYEERNRLTEVNIERFAAKVHDAWIMSEVWALENYYNEKTGGNVYADFENGKQVSQFVEANLTEQDVRNFAPERAYELEKIQQMVSYENLPEDIKELDRTQAKVTLENFARNLSVYDQLKAAGMFETGTRAAKVARATLATKASEGIISVRDAVKRGKQR